MRTTRLDRPLSRPAGGYRKCPYRSTYTNTLELLERELRHLGAHDVELLADFAEKDLRLDGTPRASARPGSPGVELRFASRTTGRDHAFTGDVFPEWQDNVRAIALAMQRLRLVDDSINTRGAQYEGFKALPGGDGAPEGSGDAAGLLLRLAGETDTPAKRAELLGSPDAVRVVYREAAKVCHPDRGGSAADMERLSAARGVLVGAGS